MINFFYVHNLIVKQQKIYNLKRDHKESIFQFVEREPEKIF